MIGWLSCLPRVRDESAARWIFKGLFVGTLAITSNGTRVWTRPYGRLVTVPLYKTVSRAVQQAYGPSASVASAGRVRPDLCSRWCRWPHWAGLGDLGPSERRSGSLCHTRPRPPAHRPTGPPAHRSIVVVNESAGGRFRSGHLLWPRHVSLRALAATHQGHRVLGFAAFCNPGRSSASPW